MRLIHGKSLEQIAHVALATESDGRRRTGRTKTFGLVRKDSADDRRQCRRVGQGVAECTTKALLVLEIEKMP